MFGLVLSCRLKAAAQEPYANGRSVPRATSDPASLYQAAACIPGLRSRWRALVSMDSVETLKNMNPTTAKHATWLVRVLDPKLTNYEFMSRGEKVNAAKFSCILVSKDPKQFVLGVVPFSFGNRNAPAEAAKQFLHNAVYEVKAPYLDPKAQPQFSSCPIKHMVVLKQPTQLREVTPAEKEKLEYPATYVDTGMNLQEVQRALQRLAGVCSSQGSAAGDLGASQGAATVGGQQNRCLINLTGKITKLDLPKTVLAAGRQRQVMALELADDTASAVEVSVWDGAQALFQGISVGEGIAIVGCTALRDGASMKLNLWENARVLRGGPVVQSLTGLSLAGQSVTILTAQFQPTASLLPPDSEGFPTCAAALANAPPRMPDQKIVQVNRCSVDVPTTLENLQTQDKQRLFATCRLRDWSGGVDVDLTQDAILGLYGHSSRDDFLSFAEQSSLQQPQGRFHVRGVLRSDATSGATKIVIGRVLEAPLAAQVSHEALSQMLGLCNIVGDMVVPAPATAIDDTLLSGMVLSGPNDRPVPAHRALLLVKGNEKSTLAALDESLPLQQQSFKVSSKNVRCLLSAGEMLVDLHGYCDFNGMLQYRLDKDTAIVSVSAWALPEDSGNPTATVEYMVKVSSDGDVVRAALLAEWAAFKADVPDDAQSKYQSPQNSDYWERAAKRLRRMESEPAPTP